MSITPLFAIEAQKLLGAGDASGAVRILEEGIAMYPEYATPYALVARSYMLMSDAEYAYEWVRRGLQRCPSHAALRSLERDLVSGSFSSTDHAEPSDPAMTEMLELSGTKSEADPTPDSEQNMIDSDRVLSARSHEEGHVEPSDAGRADAHDVMLARSSKHDDHTHEAPSASFQHDGEGAITRESPGEFPSISDPLPEDETELITDALSNVDDDNDAWSAVRDLVHDLHLGVPDHVDDAESEQEDSPAFEEQEDSPQADEQERMMDDGLSNVDDDNDAWSDVRQGIDDAEVRVAMTETEGDEEHDADVPLDTESVLHKINVVGGNVVMDKVVMKDVMGRPEVQKLKVVSSVGLGARSALRSSSMRLIPGLEFTPLRVRSGPTTLQRSLSSIDYPPFPVIRGSVMNVSPALAAVQPKEPAKKVRSDRKSRTGDLPRTQLEELAQRLERVRTPMTEEPDALSVRAANAASEPSMVTETMAKIYVQQGAIDQAVKAYTQLARMKPERRDEFEQRIRELQSSRSS